MHALHAWRIRPCMDINPFVGYLTPEGLTAKNYAAMDSTGTARIIIVLVPCCVFWLCLMTSLLENKCGGVMYQATFPPARVAIKTGRSLAVKDFVKTLRCDQ